MEFRCCQRGVANVFSAAGRRLENGRKAGGGIGVTSEARLPEEEHGDLE